MSRPSDKKISYRAKEDFEVRYGFEYNQNAINYRTEIPPIPEKPKHKPEEKHKLKKIQDIDDKILKLKETRKEKKNEIKKLNEEYDEQINTLKDHVALGRKCVLLLEMDIDKMNEDISWKSGKIKKMQSKLDNLIFEVRDLKSKGKPSKKVNKEYEEMSNRQLDEEKARIEQIMSTKVLSKKEETQLNSRIYKIQRIKQEPNRPGQNETEKTEENDADRISKLQSQISSLKEKENKIKGQRAALFKNREELEFRIQDIKEDIAIFFQKLKEIADIVDNNQHIKKLSEQSKELKENIYKLREDIAKINSEYEQKVKEYETEQEKIKWIAWATKIQERKRQQWEEEKAERKKQKAREKVNTEKETKSKDTTKGKEDEKEHPKEEKEGFERKKINKNQKEIDTCAFLIDYCKRLYPSGQNTGTQSNEEKKEVDLEAELKKGSWAKQKGIEVIQPKKSKTDQEDSSKMKFNKKKTKKQEDVVVQNNRFSHNYFVAQSFDLVKVLPPTTFEELDKIVKDLEDKVEYYLSRPDESVEQKFAKDKQFFQKTSQNQGRGKYTKSKGSNKNIINTQEFPSL